MDPKYKHLEIFNEGVFYPGAFDDSLKATIKSSPLWPIILSMHFSCGVYVRSSLSNLSLIHI